MPWEQEPQDWSAAYRATVDSRHGRAMMGVDAIGISSNRGMECLCDENTVIGALANALEEKLDPALPLAFYAYGVNGAERSPIFGTIRSPNFGALTDFHRGGGRLPRSSSRAVIIHNCDVRQHTIRLLLSL